MSNNYFPDIGITSGSPLILASLRGSAITGDKVALQEHLADVLTNLEKCDHFGRTLLTYAVLGDQPECAAFLLKCGADVNAVDSSGRSPLLWAAFKNFFSCMKLLLCKGANWRLKDCEGATALHLAARQKSPKCLSLLVKYFGSKEIDVQDNDKRTALHWSSCCGNLENVKILVKHKSNCGNPDVEGKTPIHWAASSESSDAAACVKVLLESAPMAINWNDHEGRGALHFAVADGTEAVVQELVYSKYCDLNLLDNASRTPLHLAALLGRTNIVKFLLKNGAKCSSPDANKATALHYASSNNVETVETLLMSSDMDVNHCDKDGCTPLMWAVGTAANDIVLELLERGANINAANIHGAMALHIAALSGHSNTISVLVANGALVNAVDTVGRTPLSYACEMGHAEALLTLIASGSCINLSDNEKRTALHWAVIGGHQNICSILIGHHLSCSVVDIYGRTPLFYTAVGGYTDCMSALLEYGSHVQHRDNEGFTALHWACRQGHLDAVKLLISYEVNPNYLSKTKFRYTALDLALLGDKYDVARFVVDHGGVSVIHIENEAATKIQAAYRSYRVRKALFQTERINSECISDPSACSDILSTSRMDTSNDTAETLNDSVFLNETSIAESNNNNNNNNAEDVDLAEDMFQHLTQGKPVKALLLNRKTFLKDSNSSSNNLTGSFNALKSPSKQSSKAVKGEANSSLSKDKIGSTLSLFSFSKPPSQNMQNVSEERRMHHHSLLQLADYNSSKQKPFRRFRKRYENDDGSRLQQSHSCKMKNGILSESSDILPETVVNATDHSNDTRAVNQPLKSISRLQDVCQSPQNAPVELNGFCDYPSWCYDKTLKKVAEEEWLKSLCDVTLERLSISRIPSKRNGFTA